MKFGPVPLAQAEGKILGHNIAGRDGQRVLRKGKALTRIDLDLLAQHGHTRVYVAELAPDDVGEDVAARAIAAAVCGPGLQQMNAGGGRVNLLAQHLGLARIDSAGIQAINEIDGITLATVTAHTAVKPKQLTATIKIIPYAVPAAAVQRALAICHGQPLLQVDALPARRAVLLLSGLPSVRERIMQDFDAPIRNRLHALGATLTQVDFVSLEEIEGEIPSELRLRDTLARHVQAGAQLIVLAGETAIMDRHDIVPRAIEQVDGGEITCFGAPVDPGNLLMIAYIGAVPLLGAPGCARSPKLNVIDYVLPRLIAGDRLTRRDISLLGAGGLLEEIAERPMPRERGR